MRLRASSWRKIILALAVLLAACPSQVTAAAWKFGVMGDTQWSGTDLTGNNVNTVAVNQAKACNTQFVDAGVDFVIQVGDLTDNGSNAGLQTRLGANSALTTAGIEFYGLRGNHESSGTAQTYFNTNYIPASNTEQTVAVLSGTSNYSVTRNGTKVVLLDIATAGNVANLNSATTWMGSELAAADHTQAFVFQHKNLLGQNHKDSEFGSGNDANTAQQNAFISTLQDNGVRYNISGHDHLHYRSNVTSPDGNSSVQEIICASDSYKYYTPTAPYSSRDNPFSEQLNQTGYYIYTVDGPRVTGQYYHTTPLANGDVPDNPTWTLGETFGYSLNGKQFLVASGGDLAAVHDAYNGTSMSLSGINGSNATTYDGRLVTKDINTGWTDRASGQFSHALTIWGMEDIDSATTVNPFTLTMSYDATDYTGEIHLARLKADGTWAALASTLNGDGTISASINQGGTFAVVPEPSAMILLVTGAAMFLLTLRRCRAK